jgi:CRP/FNR family transcriptional regulator
MLTTVQDGSPNGIEEGTTMLMMTNKAAVRVAETQLSSRAVDHLMNAGKPAQPVSAVARVAARRPARTLQSGEAIFMQGDRVNSIYILQQGWAFCYQTLEDGRRQIIDFAMPGDVVSFGQVAPMSYGVEALTICSFAKFSKSELDAGLMEEPGLAVEVMQSICASQSRAFDHLTNIGRRTAKERVAYLLLELVQRLSRKAPGSASQQFSLPFAQAHFADALGLSSETVCRCLSDFKSRKILVLQRGRLDLFDIEALAEEAGTILDEENWDEAEARPRKIHA